jgi:hypothetical protein
MVRAWVNHYGGHARRAKALHDVVQRGRGVFEGAAVFVS